MVQLKITYEKYLFMRCLGSMINSMFCIFASYDSGLPPTIIRKHVRNSILNKNRESVAVREQRLLRRSRLRSKPRWTKNVRVSGKSLIRAPSQLPSYAEINENLLLNVVEFAIVSSHRSARKDTMVLIMIIKIFTLISHSVFKILKL